MSAPGALLLEVAGLTKRFGAIEALRDVSLALHAGEVVAVVGENGAGKSTLIKILAGIHRPDAGTVRIHRAAPAAHAPAAGGSAAGGQPASAGARVEPGPSSPAAAIEAGVAVVHQELHLCDNLSIAANLFLGREPLRWRALGWIDRRRMEAEARAALERVGLDRDPRLLVATLAPAARQLVEIARGLAMAARVLVMDEPTSSLGRDEADALLDRVDRLRRGGVGVLYVSHRLDEVVRVADRAVVLRDGRVAGELGRGEIEVGELVRLMAGRAPAGAGASGGRQAEPAPRVGRERGVALAVRELRCERDSPALSFELRAGEILGLYGIVGAGRTELLETIFGLRRAAAGSIEVGAGSRRVRWSAAAAIAAGVALVPEERRTQGLVAEMSVAENLALAGLARRPLLARRSRRDERRRAAALCGELDVRPAVPEAEARRLSGGNQQKVVLGKWLALAPRVLLLDEPTRGVDVGARAEIHRRLRELAARGVAILLSSAETDEILALADRVLVLRRGAIAGIVTGEALREETLLRAAAGGESMPPPPASRVAGLR